MLADRPHLWAFLVGCVVVTVGVAMHLPMFWMGRFNHFHLAEMPIDDGMMWGMVLIVYGLGRARWRLMGVLTAALVIDVMKPASLGFVPPGMRVQYVVSKAVVARLPFAALSGTVVGSVVWGWLADLYGRRAEMLLSAVIFGARRSAARCPTSGGTSACAC